MNQKIRSIKEIHKYDLCLFKVGAFYHAYGRDSYILAYLFDYKLKDTSLEKGWKECGFPITNVSKIMARLEEKKINYILIDRRNNYDVDGKMDFGNLNRYQATYEKSNKYVNYKKRIANTTQDIEYKKTLLLKMIAKVKVIDFLLNLSYDKKLITEKKYYKLALALDDIVKYTSGWLKKISNN